MNLAILETGPADFTEPAFVREHPDDYCVLDWRHGAVVPGEDFCAGCCLMIAGAK